MRHYSMTAQSFRSDSGKDFTLIHIDRSLIVVDKPTRLLSVPGRGPDKQDCLVARLQIEFPDALIVHRLDYDTSGLIVLARGKAMHRELSILFQERKVGKRYVAVVDGKPSPDSGEVNLPLIVDWPNRPLHKVDFETGKPSLTLYKVLDYDETRDSSRVELVPETGRTHQLRVHMLSLGHPILGDSLYADPESLAKADRLLLHAEHLSFVHPESGERLNFTQTAGF
jgi:tRNA pseudouridine32 synthase/23S rRNA pseudouridine746 synthase